MDNKFNPVTKTWKVGIYKHSDFENNQKMWENLIMEAFNANKIKEMVNKNALYGEMGMVEFSNMSRWYTINKPVIRILDVFKSEFGGLVGEIELVDNLGEKCIKKGLKNNDLKLIPRVMGNMNKLKLVTFDIDVVPIK